MIELDGNIHDDDERKAADEGRTYELKEFDNIEKVIKTIIEIVTDRNK